MLKLSAQNTLAQQRAARLRKAFRKKSETMLEFSNQSTLADARANRLRQAFEKHNVQKTVTLENTSDVDRKKHKTKHVIDHKTEQAPKRIKLILPTPIGIPTVIIPGTVNAPKAKVNESNIAPSHFLFTSEAPLIQQIFLHKTCTPQQIQDDAADSDIEEILCDSIPTPRTKSIMKLRTTTSTQPNVDKNQI